MDALRLLKEMLYEEIGKDEHGNPVRLFHRIYDYQTILELKKWSVKGNFDRVSEMLIRAIEYKAMNIAAIAEIDHRKALDANNIDNNDILSRDWF